MVKDILTLKNEGAIEIKGILPHVLIDSFGHIWVEEDEQTNLCHLVEDVEKIIFPVFNREDD